MKHGRESRKEETELWAEKLFVSKEEDFDYARELGQKEDVPPIALTATGGKLLSMILKFKGAKKVVEVGTLFGYSGLWIAEAVGADGKLYTMESSPKNVEVAKKAFEHYGVSDRVEIVRGAAANELPKISEHGPFDAIFIDADKSNYPTYLDWAEKNIKKGGLIIGDNTYFFGDVHKTLDEIEERDQKGYLGMKEFNERLADSKKYLSVLIPTGEGMTVAEKKF